MNGRFVIDNLRSGQRGTSIEFGYLNLNDIGTFIKNKISYVRFRFCWNLVINRKCIQ